MNSIPVAELVARTPGSRQPRLLDSERHEYQCTYFYRGFILNEWVSYYCLRPVEAGTIERDGQLAATFPPEMRDWFMAQPEATALNWGQLPFHCLRDGTETNCIEIAGDLAAVAAVIDRYWAETGELG
ncbi:MAG: hypothetical protein Q8R28_03245 [Dehalococcoidia bacterium]|nr:hypothetical protein [Dehalococcoidia bacterium]